MTEDDARAWIAERWGEAAVSRLEHFTQLVIDENERQNLISAASIPTMWMRHIVDSAQLVSLASESLGLWIDVGSGGGFPGIVIALLRDGASLLVEPRRRRAEFLARAVDELGLENVSVACSRVEALSSAAAVISARAVAAPAKFFKLAENVTTSDTLFILPGGRGTQHALAEAKRHWRGVFHVKQSLTDPESKIIIANEVTRR